MHRGHGPNPPPPADATLSPIGGEGRVRGWFMESFRGKIFLTKADPVFRTVISIAHGPKLERCRDLNFLQFKA